MDHVINKRKVLLVAYYMEALNENDSRVEDVKMTTSAVDSKIGYLTYSNARIAFYEQNARIIFKCCAEIQKYITCRCSFEIIQ